MTAPDSRDSDMTLAFMAEVCKAAVGAMQMNGLANRTERLQQVADRLQALARGPQQAGGEDVPEKVVAWMNEREAWRSPRAPSEPGTHALVLADDYAALQAEVARLRAGIVHRGDGVVVPLHLYDEINATGAAWKQRAETAEAALRLAHSHLDMPALRVSHCKDAAAIDAARLVRDGDSGEG